MRFAATALPSPPATLHSVRLVTGLVLFAYVASHLANHALGLFGLAAMEAGRKLFLPAWRSPVGLAALFGSLTLHFGLALWALYRRRQLRMPFSEAAQLLLGLAIPIFLVTHVVGTHLANHLYGVVDSYTRMMLVYWARPEMGIRQVLLLLVAWTHGCVGLHFWLRSKRWYPRASALLTALGLLLPLLALLGFLEAMRETTELARNGDWLRYTLAAVRELGAAQRTALRGINDAALQAYFAAVGATLLARAVRNFHERRYRSVAVTYPDGRKIVAPSGYSVLETSRYGGVPHVSVCGGRGRCSTCRVRIGRGFKQLPPPSAAELAVLKRVGAAANVRLACQLRPAADLSVFPLLPAAATLDALTPVDDFAGEEMEICVLFADLRRFTRLAEHKLPYDIVFFLNRYFETMSAAVEEAGGIANQFTGDGVMALFGVESGADTGCRDAIRAAGSMIDALAKLSTEFSEELPEPLRMGIGIHAGPAVVGKMGRGSARFLTAIGDTVHVASRLQELTKDYRCPVIVSQSAAQRAQLDVARFPRHELAVRNRLNPIAIHIVGNADWLVLSGA
jgi:adenylate cyclase